MTTYILIKYLHFLGIFGMVGCLVAELVLMRPMLSRAEIRRVGTIDGFYGASAILLVAAGLLLWLGVGKGQEFYNQPAIYIKLSIALLVGLLSIGPTVFFLKNRKGEPSEQLHVPHYIRPLIIGQLILIACVPPLATMLAYGILFF